MTAFLAREVVVLNEVERQQRPDSVEKLIVKSDEPMRDYAK